MTNYKKTIALACTSFSGGGAERVMITLANDFIEKGVYVDYIVAKDVGPYKDLLDKRVNKLVLSRGGRSSILDRVLGFFRLVLFFKRNNPSVFMSTLREFNVFCFLAYKVSRNQSRFIVREAATLDTIVNSRSIRNIILKLLMKFSYRNSDHIVANSDSTKCDLVKYLGISEDRVTRIYNPLVLPSCMPDKRPNLIVGCGRLVKMKRFDHLIHAFSKVKLLSVDAELIILGDGPEKGTLQHLVDDLGLSESVTFAGFVDNPYEYFSRAQVFAHTSEWEGFGYVLAEAMACGASVVAYDSKGGMKEILDNGKYGNLVKNGNINLLAQSIYDCLKSPYDTSTLYDGAARFNVDDVSNSYLDVCFKE